MRKSVETHRVDTEKAVETHRVDTEPRNPQAQWQHVELPSARLAARIQEFEASADGPDPNRRGFKLADGQRAICNWFGHALDVALDEEMRQVPVKKTEAKRMCSHRCRWHREDDDYSRVVVSHVSGILPGTRRRRPLCHSDLFTGTG